MPLLIMLIELDEPPSDRSMSSVRRWLKDARTGRPHTDLGMDRRRFCSFTCFGIASAKTQNTSSFALDRTNAGSVSLECSGFGLPNFFTTNTSRRHSVSDRKISDKFTYVQQNEYPGVVAVSTTGAALPRRPSACNAGDSSSRGRQAGRGARRAQYLLSDGMNQYVRGLKRRIMREKEERRGLK
jgi:hypothetical protein